LPKYGNSLSVRHIHTTEHNPALKKKGILSFATTWMNVEDPLLREISQAQKDKCHIDHMWN
jgi:hypothetical protein